MAIAVQEIAEMQEIKYGECHCGCGGKTKIPDKTNAAYGWTKGVPRKYMMNHDKRKIPHAEDAVPFKIEGVYCRLIPLTQGQYAIVWESRYAELSKHAWQAHWTPQMGSYYAVRTEWGTRVTVNMHAVIAGTPRGKQTDHLNHVTLDNRDCNVRPASATQNAMNRAIRSDNKSGFRGVHWSKAKQLWVATIQAYGFKEYIGAFSAAILAAKAYDARAKEVYGVFAKLNFPNE